MTDRTLTQADIDAGVRDWRRQPTYVDPRAGGYGDDDGVPAPAADARFYFAVLLLCTLIFGATLVVAFLALNGQIRWA